MCTDRWGFESCGSSCIHSCSYMKKTFSQRNRNMLTTLPFRNRNTSNGMYSVEAYIDYLSFVRHRALHGAICMQGGRCR